MANDRGQLDWFIVIAILVLAGQWTAFAQSTSAPTTQPIRVVNPHSSMSGCMECHDQEHPGPIAIEQAEEICRRCHDGQTAVREVHPVGRLFLRGEIEKPRDWPAPAGRLGCMTCHDMHQACNQSATKSSEKRAFLRQSPTDTPGGFCGACHVAAAKAKGGRYNPHTMLKASGKPIRESCLFCHMPSFKLDSRLIRTGNAGLRNNGIGICVGCHPRHSDYFEPGHIGLTLTSEIKQKLTRITRQQDLAPTSQPADTVRTALPLEVGSRIVCATCHNPHPMGLFPLGSELNEGAMTKDSSNPLALRGPAKDVCRVCHDQ